MRNGIVAGQISAQFKAGANGSSSATSTLFGQYRGNLVNAFGSCVDPGAVGVGTFGIMAGVNNDPNLMTLIATGGVMSP